MGRKFVSMISLPYLPWVNMDWPNYMQVRKRVTRSMYSTHARSLRWYRQRD